MKNLHPKTLEEAFDLITSELRETFVRKHRDYGKGNILDTGELGIAFRISDKLSRLKNILQSGKKPNNESIDDSWIDIGVYAVITLMYRKKWFQKLSLQEQIQKK